MSKIAYTGCTSPCIYTAEDDDTKRFCFADGDLNSECMAEGINLIPVLGKSIEACNFVNDFNIILDIVYSE